MQTNHASALRGLSIAVIVISAIAILGCLICVVFLGVGGSYLANVPADTWEYYMYDGDYYSYDYYGIDGSDMAAIMALLIGFGGVALGYAILFTVPALVAGILGLRNSNDPAKLGLVFGWSLAGAICALLTGNMVTMVLLIIVCVFAYKDKQLAAAQPVVIAQPVAPMQPVAPVAAPAASVTAAPAQPAASETATVEGIVTPTAIIEEESVTETTKTE